MASSFIAGVYPENTFDTANPNTQQQQAQAAAAQDIATSGMGAVMLASFHVSSEGDINYNNTNIVTSGQASGLLNPNLPELLDQIQGAGSTIVASFGGGGTFNGNAIGFWDFTHVKNLIAQYPNPADNPFFQNLAVLFKTYPAITGLDIDLEDYSTDPGTDYDSFTSTLVTVINWLNEQGKIATIAPYEAPDFWTKVLEQCVVNNQQQVAWINLQNAMGTLSQFMPVLQAGNIGWTDVPSYVLAGLQIGGMSPSAVQEVYAQIAQEQSGLRGGWLWTYEDFDGTPASQFASAIQQGLGGTA